MTGKHVWIVRVCDGLPTPERRGLRYHIQADSLSEAGEKGLARHDEEVGGDGFLVEVAWVCG